MNQFMTAEPMDTDPAQDPRMMQRRMLAQLLMSQQQGGTMGGVNGKMVKQPPWAVKTRPAPKTATVGVRGYMDDEFNPLDNGG